MNNEKMSISNKREKINSIKKKLNIIGIRLTGNSNDWALEIEKDGLVGYIDISGSNQIVMPQYKTICILKHFILCKEGGVKMHVMTKGNIKSVLSKWNDYWCIRVTTENDIGTAVGAKDNKIQLFRLEDASSGILILAVNSNGEVLKIKDIKYGKLTETTIKSRGYSAWTKKEICKLVMSEYEDNAWYSRITFKITLDEDLNILECEDKGE